MPATATQVMVCPECGEQAIPRRPAVPPVAGRDDGTWSHTDGQPLCPVVDRPAEPVRAERFGPELAGAWLDGSALRTADELSVSIIRLAVAHGLDLDRDDREALDAWEQLPPDGGGCRHGEPDLSEWLWELACAAVDHLNTRTVGGAVFEIDDGLVLTLPDESSDDDALTPSS